jgi:hypothetical protein
MKLTTVNPLPFVAKTSVEHQLCSKVEALSGEVVLSVWTPETYPFEKASGEKVELEANYEIRTGRLSNGLFASGSIYLGFVREGQIEVEFEGGWKS